MKHLMTLALLVGILACAKVDRPDTRLTKDISPENKQIYNVLGTINGVQFIKKDHLKMSFFQVTQSNKAKAQIQVTDQASFHLIGESEADFALKVVFESVVTTLPLSEACQKDNKKTVSFSGSVAYLHFFCDKDQENQIRVLVTGIPLLKIEKEKVKQMFYGSHSLFVIKRVDSKLSFVKVLTKKEVFMFMNSEFDPAKEGADFVAPNFNEFLAYD